MRISINFTVKRPYIQLHRSILLSSSFISVNENTFVACCDFLHIQQWVHLTWTFVCSAYFSSYFSIFLKALLCCPFHMPKANCRYYANKGSLLGFPVIAIIRFYSKLLSSELRMMILVMTGYWMSFNFIIFFLFLIFCVETI